MAIDDFNNDHLLDIIVANSEANKMSILLSYDSRLFVDMEAFTTGYESHSFLVSLDDFNNDVKLDFTIICEEPDSLNEYLNRIN